MRWAESGRTAKTPVFKGRQRNLLLARTSIQWGVKLRSNKLVLRTVVWVLAAAGMAGAQASVPSTPPPKAQDSPIVKDFQERVAQYLKLRTKQAGKSPRPTAATDKLADKRDQMADSVRDIRSNARQGDLFTPAIAQYFRRQIAATLNGPRGARIRASLKHAEPLHGISLRVNEPYPQSIPLQSTPPSLLQNLPTLPKELQYRIVDSELVLLDIAPNTVVDYIPHVFPEP